MPPYDRAWEPGLLVNDRAWEFGLRVIVEDRAECFDRLCPELVEGLSMLSALSCTKHEIHHTLLTRSLAVGIIISHITT